MYHGTNLNFYGICPGFIGENTANEFSCEWLTNCGWDKMVVMLVILFILLMTSLKEEIMFLKQNIWFSNKILLQYVPQGVINNKPALIQIIVGCCIGDKLLSESMMICFNDPYMHPYSASMSQCVFTLAWYHNDDTQTRKSAIANMQHLKYSDIISMCMLWNS